MTKKIKICFFILICFCFYCVNFAIAFIKDTGTDGIIDYEKYGYFENLGTKDYKYTLLDKKGLGDMQGEGIYPNGWSIFSNPDFIKAKNKGLLEGSKWEFTHIDNPALMYYKWVDCFQESAALRQFFVAEAFQKGGYIKQAIKAYYSILVFFPRATETTYWQTPWYVAEVALNRIHFLLNNHKEIGWQLVGDNLYIKNKFDNYASNDIFYINPGKLKLKKDDGINKLSKKLLNKEIKRFGTGNISLVRDENAHWQLKIDNKDYLIKGVAYSPVAKGEGLKNKNLQDWSLRDENKNNRIDAVFDSVVDEKVVGDFQLMKDMEVNTIRIYGDIQNKNILNILFNDFNIRTMIGIDLDFLRKGNLNLDDKSVLSVKDLKAIEKVINHHKDENYLLMWILGNEDNYYINSKQSKNFYRLVNEVSKVVRRIDKNHPIVICNGDLFYLDQFVQECKDVDIFGANVYRGEYGFGYSFWNDLKKYWNKPVLITEYGCPAFKNLKNAEQKQVNYHKNCWEDIEYNSAGNLNGVGLCLGGIVFEWLDEWWKSGNPSNQDHTAQWAGPFPDGWMYEEFLGICSQGEISDPKLTRKLRKVYYFYKKEWNKKK